MSISIFPEPVADGGATDTSFAATIPATQTTYEQVGDFSAGVYSISIDPTSTNAQLTFTDDTSVIATTTTTSGVVSLQLSSPATAVYITTLAGGTANAIVSITKTAAILTPDDIGNGTLDTINTTGTYNQTGLLSVLAFGGGAAGPKGGIGGGGEGAGGAGGASGQIVYGFVYNTGATTVTVGAKGTAAVSNNTNIVAPTLSSFGNLLTAANNFFYVSGAGAAGAYSFQGSPNGGGAGSASRTFPSFNSTSTTGGGGGGAGSAGNQSGGVGGGSGIGTGGTGAPSAGGSATNSNPSTAGTAATGKAAGGGGGAGTGNNHPSANGRFGGDGSDGVVYILRGF